MNLNHIPLAANYPRRLVLLVTLSLVLSALLVGCGKDDPQEIKTGPPVKASDAQAKLDLPSGAPTTALDAQIVLDMGSAAISRFEAWNPISGVRTPLLNIARESTTPSQVVGATGKSLAIWRGAPSDAATGRLLLYSLADGTFAELSASAAVNAAISESHVLWLEGNNVQLHVIAGGATETLYTLTPQESATAVSLDNDRAAWLTRTAEKSTVTILDLKNRQKQTLDPQGTASQVLLADGGKVAVWTDGKNGLLFQTIGKDPALKFLDSKDTLGGLTKSGQFVSWIPRPGDGAARAGYFDTKTKTLRFVTPQAGMSAKYSAVMGPWFVWLEIPAGSTDGTKGTYYFIKM